MICVQEEDFDHCDEYNLLRENADGEGAIVTFTGLVRDFCDSGTVNSMILEHYPGMTEKALMEICSEARNRWELGHVRVIHRTGQLHSGDQIVFVGVTSKHRQDAFSAAEFIMDYLKTKAPLWKKECTTQGTKWVKAKDTDKQAAQRW